MEKDLILSQDDLLNFREWVNLNLDGLTWQGRFKKEFEKFWNAFFEAGISLSKIVERFDYACTQVKTGSLSSWFRWLKNKFICYIFIFKKISINELSQETKLELSKISTIIRNFLVDEYPHLFEEISNLLHIATPLNENKNLNFNTIVKNYNLQIPTIGSFDEEIMPSMEVTLFEEWSFFTNKMKAEFKSKQFNLVKIKKRSNFLKYIKIIQEVSLLFIILILIMNAVKYSNVWYEKFLLSKVNIYEPQFKWPAKNKVFKSLERKPTKEFKLNYDDIPDISKSEKITEFFDPENYNEESEVSVAGLDNLPKDFKDAENEVREENQMLKNKNGLRETTNGTTTIYRLMMNSANTYETRDKISELVLKFGGNPLDETSLGADVPGGVYYNLAVPQKNFKEFMKQIMGISESKLFQTNTSNVKNVPGKLRVFIMVKSI